MAGSSRPESLAVFVPEPFQKPAAHFSAAVCAHRAQVWVTSAGLDGAAYGTHSLRRTEPTQIYKKTGNPRGVQLLLGHTKLESTVHYLGVQVEDALSLSEQIEL